MAEIYIPEFETQTDENAPLPWTNCTLASVSMLIDWWTWGVRRTNDVVLRAASGISAAVGTNFAACRVAAQKVVGLDLQFSEWDRSGNRNLTWAQLRTHLSSGGGAAVAGQYKAIRGFTNDRGQAMDRWQPGGDFGHAVYVTDYRPKASGGDGRVRWMDPLGRGTYTGDRVPLDALWAFIFKSGQTEEAYVAAAHGFAGTRPARVQPGPTGAVVFKPTIVTQEWSTVEGATFTRADGTSGRFLQSVLVRSIAELTVGGKDCRLIDYGNDHEALLMFRSGLTPLGGSSRIVGSPIGIYTELQRKQFEATAKAAGRKEGIDAARADLADLS